MAHRVYMTIEGSRQGKFQSAQGDSKIPVLNFQTNVVSPRDIATGQAAGKRQYKPIKFVKEWGTASPQIHQALRTGEVLKKVTIEFVQTTRNGKEETYYTGTLNDAVIAHVQPEHSASVNGRLLRLEGIVFHVPGVHNNEIEKWKLIFQKIEFDNKPGKSAFSDNWTK